MLIITQLLYLACKLWKKEEDSYFNNIILSLKRFDPKLSDLVSLFQVIIDHVIY
jgi:hypothetical protein